jgi:predicted pyridoxine 5'-phosphate oxidase superfamily flavin-nucleotide-binding protein
MKDMEKPISDIAFTPSVKAIQERKGSRDAYRRMEENGGWKKEITGELAAFIADQRSFFFATASREGTPYIQHRGGPRGFLKVVGTSTLAFIDFKGNRQFITQGNLAENPKAHMFLVDYAARQRIKLWGVARVVEDDPQLIERFTAQDYKARAEQVIVFEISAWDVNCPQHIPVRYDAEDVERALAERDARIAELEAKISKIGII